jgi:hypothetical protein
MGMMKNYLLTLLASVADDTETGDAVEYAISQGWVSLTYDLARDTATIERQLCTILEKFRRAANENEAALQQLVSQIDDYK